MSSYNHEKFLSEAIESILNQTFRDLELIIVDDCSSDKSAEIIQNYLEKDPRVQAVFHQRNMGISRTANDALKLVRGEFLSFIGSDDAWYPNKLERQLRYMNGNEDKILWADGQIMDLDGVVTGRTVSDYMHAPRRRNGNIFQELLREDFIFGQGLLVKSEFVKDIVFEEKYAYVSDHLFFIKLAEQHDFLFMPEALAKYRLHGGNITRKYPDLWLKENINLRRDLIKKYGNAIGKKSMSDIYYKIGHALAELGEKDLARGFYVKAFRNDPFSLSGFLYAIHVLTGGQGLLTNFLLQIYYKANYKLSSI
jgi:teichuronic acid biosynthesis glycosyltransferase TuaG